MEDTASYHAAKKVGIAFNLKKADSDEKVVDAQAEYDSLATVHSIRDALTAAGYQVSLIEADRDFAENVKKSGVDIVFNIAEGRGGRGREAQVPAVLDMLGVPYTGSDAATLSIALDKALTKRVLSASRVLSPKGVVVKHGEKDFHVKGLSYPVIVKPNAEGSSKGISDVSVVGGARALRKLVKYDLENYDSDMLVEEFIRGREFTVAMLGNGEDVKVFPPLEIVFVRGVTEDYNVYSYHVKQEYEKYVRLDCPSSLSSDKQEEMKAVAKKVFLALECKDFARADFMMSEDGKIYFIEINPLPGLAPHYSDFPYITECCGMSHAETVKAIIYNAEKRIGLQGDL